MNAYRSKSRRVRGALLSLTAAGLAVPAYAQTTATFDQSFGHNWSDQSVWDTNVVPNNGQPDLDDTYNAVVGGGTLNLDIDATIEAFTFSGLSLGLAGDHTLTINDLFTWSGGSLQGGSDTGVIDADGGILLNPDSFVSFSNWTINNAGAATITSAGANPGAGFGVNAILNNTGILDFQSKFWFQRQNTSALITNAGTIQKSAGADTSQINVSINQAATGVIDAQTGTLQLAGGNFAGTLKSTGGTLQFFDFGSPALAFDNAEFQATNGGAINVQLSAALTGTITGTGDGTGSVRFTSGDLLVATGETATLDFDENASFVFNWADAEGTLVNAGHATWEGGNISGTGLTNQGHFTLGGSGPKDIGDTDPSGGEGSTLTNEAGATIVQTNDSVYLNYDSAIVNAGTYDIQLDNPNAFALTVIHTRTNSTTPAIVNTGTFQRSAGGGVLAITDAAFSSTGAIRSTSGTLSIQSATDISGQVEADGGKVELMGDNLSVQGVDFDVRNGGQIVFSQFFGNPPVAIGGTFTSTGDGTGEILFTDANAADATIFNAHADAPIVLVDDLDSPGYVYNDGTLRLGGGHIVVGDGTEASTTRFFNRGTLNIASSGVIGGFGADGNAGTFENLGTVIQTHYAFVFDATTIINARNARTTAVWDIQDDDLVIADQSVTPAAQFINEGVFKKTGGTGFANVSINFTNRNGGVVRVESGILTFSDFTQTGADSRVELAGGTFAGQNSSSLTITDGTVTGNGTIDGTLNHDGGVLAPGDSAGTILFDDGFYNQGENATLAIEIGGTVAGDEYDQLIVDPISGYAANLAGTIEVALINGFAPTLGQTFDIIVAGGINDQGFTLDVTTPLGGGLFFEHAIVPIGGNDDALRLIVVPEPATLGLVAAGLAGLLRRRRGATA